MALIKHPTSYIADGPFLEENLSNVYIGPYTSIAKSVYFDCGFNHNYDLNTTYPFSVFYPEWNHIRNHPLSKGHIFVGADCWIGFRSTIMSNVKISDGSIVACHSVVTKDIPPYEIWGGVPAKFIKKRFSDEIIQMFLTIKWFNWPEEIIRKNVNIIQSNNREAIWNLYKDLKSKKII